MTYKAVDIIDLQALKNEQDDKETINRILAEASVNEEIETLKNKLLYDCDVTINFHPDRISNNGKLVIKNLLIDGEYHNQHKTGISNGGLGGSRNSWEQRLFHGAYHKG